MPSMSKREKRVAHELNSLQKFCIKSILNPPTIPITINEILGKNTQDQRAKYYNIPLEKICDKEELHYMYKKGAPRSYLSMNTRLKYLQSIWSWRMLIDLCQNVTYINVDESSFTKAVKTNYSWLPRGESNSIVNTWGTERAVVLFALFSSGDWIWYITKDTTNSKNFWKFLILLAKFIELWTQLNILE